MFWLKKLLGTWVAPLPIGAGLIVAGGLVWWFASRRRWGQFLIALGVAIPLISSHRGLAETLISQLEDQHPPATSAADIDYIVVLGGGHADNPRLPWTTQLHISSQARLLESVRLHRLNEETVLVFCGPRGDRTHSHAEVLARAAESLGVGRKRMQTVPDVRDTLTEVIAVKEIVGDAPILLVTSAWHMPRAMGLAQKAGLNARAAPTDYLSPLNDFPGRMWGEFSLEGLHLTSRAWREFLGLTWSKMRGQI